MDMNTMSIAVRGVGAFCTSTSTVPPGSTPGQIIAQRDAVRFDEGSCSIRRSMRNRDVIEKRLIFNYDYSEMFKLVTGDLSIYGMCIYRLYCADWSYIYK